MKRFPVISVMLLSILPVLAVDTAPHPFSHYQVILDREPFGAAPVEPSAEELMADRMAEEVPPFVKSLRMCAITHTRDSGLRVGIVEIGSKPKSHLMRVGEVLEDGLELVDADYDREGALLKKDGVMYWVYLDGTTGTGPGGAHSSAAAPQTGDPRVTASMAGSMWTSPETYAKRARKRSEIVDGRRGRSEERASLGPEAMKSQLMEYQKELIRSDGELGMPLPIALTKEADDELVAEGVLPP